MKNYSRIITFAVALVVIGATSTFASLPEGEVTLTRSAESGLLIQAHALSSNLKQFKVGLYWQEDTLDAFFDGEDLLEDTVFISGFPQVYGNAWQRQGLQGMWYKAWLLAVDTDLSALGTVSAWVHYDTVGQFPGHPVSATSTIGRTGLVVLLLALAVVAIAFGRRRAELT